MTPDGTKKKKLTSLEKGDGRRLVEYLVVVSSLPRKPEEGVPERKGGEEWSLSTSFDDEDVVVEHGFKPVITARYPLNDHEDNPLHENVTFFCHPSGAIHLKKESHMPKVRRCKCDGDRFVPLLTAFCKDSLFRCNRRNGSPNVWHLLDALGAFRHSWEEEKTSRG